MKDAKLSVIVRYLFLWSVVFLFTTEIPLVSFLTTRRLALFIAILRIFTNRNEAKHVVKIFDKGKLRSFFAYLFIVVIISICHAISRDTSNTGATYLEPWYYIYIVLYILVFSIFCAAEFRSLKEFVLVMTGVYIFQTVVVIGGLINSDFRQFVYDNFYAGDDRFEKTIGEGTRLIGINLYGADGSVKMSTAVLSLVALKVVNKIKTLWFWLFYSIIFIGTIFVGRTGVIVEVLLLFPLIAADSNKIKNILQIATVAVIIVSVASYLLSLIDPTIRDILMDWITEVLDAESRASTNEGVLQQGVPPFSLDLLFGTGMDVGYKVNGIIYTSDSGLIRTYIAYGIVGFLFYYAAMYKILTSVAIDAKKMRLFFCVCVALAYVIEYKEPFMLKYMFPQAILACRLLYVKDRIAQQ